MGKIKIDSKNKTLRLVISAIMITIGTVLSMFKFNGLWVYGGGVTFCAMLPLVMTSFIYGPKWGLVTAFAFSLVQMILGVHNVLYGTSFLMMVVIALLDYIVAYTVIGLAGIFKGKFKNRIAEIVIGTVLALSLRLLCHFLSGWMIWDALWPNNLGMASWLYSITYNGSYMIPEIVITAAVAVILESIIKFSSMADQE